MKKFKTILKDKSLRNRILFVLGALVAFRLLAAVPIPGIDNLRLNQVLDSNQFIGFLDVFSGGGLSNLSLVMLGVGPYITASIIMQLLTVMVPRLKALYSEEGEAGRKKFSQYSRIITVPLAFIQGYGLLALFQKQGVFGDIGGGAMLFNVLIIVAGAVFLMWLGELVSEFGIGNGVSLIIFAGIVARLPRAVGQLAFAYNPSDLPTYIAFALVALIVIAGVVFITEAERPIPITYAREARGGRAAFGGVHTYLPMRMNQAGVMPIIFALSILLIPQLAGNILSTISTNPTILKIAETLAGWQQTSPTYIAIYFIGVFFFTYFYTAITFDPESMSSNLQKNGAFIPGIRPGAATEEYVGKVLTRVTFVGALFLGFIAILPIILQSITGIASLAIGGTALLIVVNVITDLMKKIDAQVTMREY